MTCPTFKPVEQIDPTPYRQFQHPVARWLVTAGRNLKAKIAPIDIIREALLNGATQIEADGIYCPKYWETRHTFIVTTKEVATGKAQKWTFTIPKDVRAEIVAKAARIPESELAAKVAAANARQKPVWVGSEETPRDRVPVDPDRGTPGPLAPGVGNRIVADSLDRLRALAASKRGSQVV